jgi:hypothetical protein
MAETESNLGEIGLMVSTGVTTTELLNELSEGPYVPKTRYVFAIPQARGVSTYPNFVVGNEPMVTHVEPFQRCKT